MFNVSETDLIHRLLICSPAGNFSKNKFKLKRFRNCPAASVNLAAGQGNVISSMNHLQTYAQLNVKIIGG